MVAIINQWDADPLRHFTDFVRSYDFVETGRSTMHASKNEPVSDQSALIYTLMFGKFARWMGQSGKRLSTLDEHDLLEFIALRTNGRRDLNSKIAYRYLRLLERCYTHLEAAPNPAQRALYLSARQPIGQDQEMVALSPEQFARFMCALPVHSVKFPTGKPFAGWKRRRDRAMQLMMLCAGLRVSEAIGLLVGEVAAQPELDGSLKLTLTAPEKQPTLHEHATFLRALAVPDALRWMAERRAMGCAGDLLFPASVRGEPLDKATVYRQVKATFARAGIAIARAGGRTLRNTFAVHELDMGATDQELMRHLGLALERSTVTYSQARARLGAP